MKRIETYLLVSTLFLGVLFTSNSSIANLSLLNPPAEPTVVKVGFYLSDINDVNEQQVSEGTCSRHTFTCEWTIIALKTNLR